MIRRPISIAKSGANQAAAARAVERQRKERERALAAQEKERKRRYVESRVAGVAADNKRLESQIRELESLLATALRADPWIDVESLKRPLGVKPFDAGELGRVELVPDREGFVRPPLSGMKKLVPGAKVKHAAVIAEGERRYEAAVAARDRREALRRSKLEQAQEAHAARIAAAMAERRRQSAALDRLRAEFEAGDQEAIVTYFDLVLRASRYPESFTRRFRLAYVAESRQLVVEFDLPPVSVIPTIRASIYVKTKDEVTRATRPVTQIKSLYGNHSRSQAA